jgi:hypothetical protein
MADHQDEFKYILKEEISNYTAISQLGAGK